MFFICASLMTSDFKLAFTCLFATYVVKTMKDLRFYSTYKQQVFSSVSWMVKEDRFLKWRQRTSLFTKTKFERHRGSVIAEELKLLEPASCNGC